MLIRITYTKNGERHDLEWVTDGTWTVERTLECFRKRYPTAAILAYLRLDQPCQAPH